MSKFYSSLDLSTLQVLGADPTAAQGRVYLNTTTGAKWYDGAAWRVAADLNSTQTFTNKSLDAAKVTNHSDYTEVSTPASPAAGFQRVYTKSDGKLYIKNSAGVETAVGAGAVSGPGTIPVGTVVALAFVTGAYTAPSSGTVDANGFMLADGATVRGVNTVTGAVPNLTTGVFLRGSTSSGSGGASSVTLTTAELPAHSHTMGNHTHGVTHDHAYTNTTTPSDTSHQHAGNQSGSSFACNGGSTPYGFVSFLTGNSVNANAPMTLSYVTGTQSVNSHVHGFDPASISVTSDPPSTNTTSITPAASGFSILPTYVQVKYIIRVN
jgi:hypothetical protein